MYEIIKINTKSSTANENRTEYIHTGTSNERRNITITKEKSTDFFFFAIEKTIHKT